MDITRFKNREKMIKQKKLKILPPTLREKKRYVKFKIISEEQISSSSFETNFWNLVLEFYGEYETSSMNVRVIKNLFDTKKQVGVIQCSHRSTPKLILLLGLISRIGDSRINIKIEKVSGTLKSLGIKK